MQSFEIEISTLHPSQLYINEDKLQSIVNTISSIGIDNLEPVPIKKFGDLLVLTDGHTRVFAQYQMGKSSVKAYWEDTEMDWDVYRICIEWCIEESITSIDKLENRIISDSDYQNKWLKRCQEMRTNL